MSVHKYQKKQFVIQPHNLKILLETSSYEKASELEHQLIVKHDSTNPEFGYNKRLGDSRYPFAKHVQEKRSEKVKRLRIYAGKNNSMWGRKQSEETKEKIRQKALLRHPSTFDSNRNKTPEQLRKLHEGRDAYRKKYGNSKGFRGRKHSEETKQKMRDARMKRS